MRRSVAQNLSYLQSLSVSLEFTKFWKLSQKRVFQNHRMPNPESRCIQSGPDKCSQERGQTISICTNSTALLYPSLCVNRIRRKTYWPWTKIPSLALRCWRERKIWHAHSCLSIEYKCPSAEIGRYLCLWIGTETRQGKKD